MSTKNLSLLINTRECYTILKSKLLKNYYISKIIQNHVFLCYLAFQWFLLTLGLSDIQIINKWIGNNLYWFLLGILSSIGLGTGLQTGVLFVFPYIISTFNQNKDDLLISLNNTDDRNYTDILNYTLKINSTENNYTYTYSLSDEDIYGVIYKTYFACLRVALVWGVGTALGEAPPYLIAYNIDISDKKATSKLYKMFGDNEEKVRGYIEKTIYYLKRHSFTTILLLSAWPNAVFDMCGVSAGLVKLSFSQFIIPTIIGKAFIKNPIQLGVILYYYGFFGDYVTEREEIGYLYMGWIIFVVSFTLYFIKEAIENLVNS
jgi:membrane protein YqaA with SNARE-associated domain